VPPEATRSRQRGPQRPVVRIRYEVPGEGAARELPFVVGVLGNFAGDGLRAQPSFRQRDFQEVNRENFDAVLNGMQPSLRLRVSNVLGDVVDEELVVNLSFTELDDFDPSGVALQVPELRSLLEARARLVRHRSQLESHAAESPGELEHVDRQLVELDANVGALLDVILHHPRFQRLEAAWRGLSYLVRQTPQIDRSNPREKPRVKILAMCVGWSELDRDFRDRVDVDRTTLFRKVYDQHFGTAGGEPLGLMIGDYTVRPQGSDEEGAVDDREVLQDISRVAAAAFCPFVVGLSPSFLGLDSFAELQQRVGVENLFGRLRSAIAWQSFRRSEDARFVGLAAPRVLLRLPWSSQRSASVAESGTRGLFRYEEDVGDGLLRHQLWGHAGWAFAETAIRSFLQGGWFADLTGVQPGEITRGVVAGLPVESFHTDRVGLQQKMPVDLSIDEEFGEELTRNGVLSLCQCYGSPFPAFFAAPSIQDAQVYDSAAASANAWLSTSLETMLCVGRFAHHVKVLGRDLLGSMHSPEELEAALHSWIVQYVADLPNPTPEQRAKRPLSAAKIAVHPDPGRMGGFLCEIHLQPHFSLERMVASIKLQTVLAAPTHAVA
jgi:type VI secretion system protein ImpD